MNASDEPGMLIKPEVTPDNKRAATPKHESKEEKKQRIDEALMRFDAATGHGGQALTPEISTVASTPAAEHDHSDSPAHRKRRNKISRSRAHSSSEHLSAKETEQYIVAHAADMLGVLSSGGRVPSEAATTTTAVIAPTAPDPDAPIAALVHEKEIAEAQAQAEADAVRAAEAQRYHASDDPFHHIENKKAFITLLAIWLGAIPVAVLISVTLTAIFKDSPPAALGGIALVIEYALGIYGALGWITLVVFYMRKRKDW